MDECILICPAPRFSYPVNHSPQSPLTERMNIPYLNVLLILAHSLSIQAYILGVEHRNEWNVEKVDATNLDGLNQTTALEGE